MRIALRLNNAGLGSLRLNQLMGEIMNRNLVRYASVINCSLAAASLALGFSPAAWGMPSPQTSSVKNKVVLSDASAKTVIGSGFYSNADGSPLMELIRGAERTIDIEIYQMEDGDVRQAIRDALQKGVIVRIIHDPSPVGKVCDVFGGRPATDPDCADQQALVGEVNQAQGSYVAFNRAELCGIPGQSCFEHGKMVIADGTTALISTGNFDSTNLCNLSRNPSRCDRDYTLITRDLAVVATLNSVFASDLAGVRYDVSALLTPEVNAKLTLSPFSLAPIVDFIKSAKTSILVETQYLKEPTINAALVEAARSGVAVSVDVSSACAFGVPKPNAAAQWTATYSEFESAGIQIQIFTRQIKIDGKDGYLHAKAIVVDGSSAWVGSVNGSTESVSKNREFGLFFSEPSQVDQLRSIMLSDQTNPSGESWQDSLTCAKDR